MRVIGVIFLSMFIAFLLFPVFIIDKELENKEWDENDEC